MKRICGAVYVRFSKKAVFNTLERAADAMIVTVDVDKAGGVVGVEAIGFDEFSISGILRMAKVRADNVDFGRVRFRGTPRFAEGDLGKGENRIESDSIRLDPPSLLPSAHPRETTANLCVRLGNAPRGDRIRQP